MTYFFLSYASVDGDPFMESFYRDLLEEVRARTGLSLDEIGFRDVSNLQVGSHWPTELGNALCTARAFVAMCSPSYFVSTQCGKEWQLFTALAKRRQPGMSGAPANLLPITWIPTRKIPSVARDVQASHEELGSVYAREGLQFVSRLRRHRDDYQLFVTRLAERIVAVGDSYSPLPIVQLPTYEDTLSAFQIDVASGVSEPVSPGTSRNALAPAVATSAGGPRHVNFVVVAAPAESLSPVRREIQYYGATPHDWSPFKPLSDQRICVFAQNIASTKDLTSALATAERSIVDLITLARQKNEVVVLIVDVWTTRLDPYRGVMREYDELNAPTSGVMVPWSTSDAELEQHAAELHDDLRTAFPNNTTRGDTVFRTVIPTEDSFRSALEEILAELQSRVFEFGSIGRRAGGSRIVERPILSPPP